MDDTELKNFPLFCPKCKESFIINVKDHIETERMYLYPLSDEEMRLVIEKESDPEMKQAYTEIV